MAASRVRSFVARSMSRVVRAVGIRASMPVPPLSTNVSDSSANTRHRNRSKIASRTKRFVSRPTVLVRRAASLIARSTATPVR